MEILGGGGTFGLETENGTLCQFHRLILASGDCDCIQLQCDTGRTICTDDDDVEVRDNLNMSLVSKKQSCAASLHSQDSTLHQLQGVDATLLFRIAPYYLPTKGGNCSIANDACAKPFTIPLRFRQHSTSLNRSIVEASPRKSVRHKQRGQHIPQNCTHSVDDVAGVQDEDHLSPQVLQITPRQLLIVESSQVDSNSELLSTQFYFCLREYSKEGLPSQEKLAYPNCLRDGEKVRYSIRCPHTGICLSPSRGVLTKINPGVLVTVSISRKEAMMLQCTSIEIEYAEGNKRTVPLQVRCSAVVDEQSLRQQSFIPSSSQPSSILNTSNSEIIINADVYAANFDHCVYFKGAMVNFGTISVGSLATVKVRLCNGSFDNDEELYVLDPCAPFAISHHYMKVKSRSYVRLPVRFIPNIKGDFQALLTVKILPSKFLNATGDIEKDGTEKYCQITLVGTAI